MTSILFRCDASLSIGSGHVMRCRTLARELKRRGATVIFLCRCQSGDLIHLLEQEFLVLPLPELSIIDSEGLSGRDLYSAWLGCSQVQDAVDCLHALGSIDISHVEWLVLDHYGLDEIWQCHLQAGLSRDYPLKLLVIDDLADRQHQADLLLDQNFFGDITEHRYEGLLSNQCRTLLGPHYALLGPEYAQLHQVVPNRTELHRVLVFFGGVDPDNLTGRTLEALMEPALADLAVDVVLGIQSPHWQAVEDLVAQRPLTTLHAPLKSLSGLIARADLAVGASGATTWERACLRLPTLVVAIAANQVPFAEALHDAGHLQFLGDAATVTMQQIRSALLSWRSNPFPKDAGGNLTDGFGASRLALSMLGPQAPVALRMVNAGDEALILRWANDPQVRPSSFLSDSSTSPGFYKWFQKLLNDPNRMLLIAETCDCPIGHIFLDRQSQPVEGTTSEVVFDLSLDPCSHGFGLSADLLRLGLQVMEQTWGSKTESVGEGKPLNQSFNACYSRAGFIQNLISSAIPFASNSESLVLPPSRITVLSDRGSWLNSFIPELIYGLWRRGHVVRWLHNPDELAAGEVCFLLSCGRLLSAEQLAFHRHNLVVHESALPRGQGWSPMTWQILEGASQIPVTLFEAVADLDTGPIYLQKQIILQGHELVAEWRALQAETTLSLCLEWLDHYNKVVAEAQPQSGEPSYYRRRRPADSQLDLESPLAQQLNLLRVVDNKLYPAFLSLGDRTLQIQVFGDDNDIQKI